MTQQAESAGLRGVEFVRGSWKRKSVSPNGEADRLERLWQWGHRPDHPLRKLPDPDAPVEVDVAYNYLVLRSEG